LTKTKLIFIGGGEHAKVILDGLSGNNVEVVAVFDPTPNAAFAAVPHFIQYDAAIAEDARAIIAIGDNTSRKRVANSVKHSFMNFIHPSATVSHQVMLGVGCMVMQRAIIQVGAQIGNHVIINTSASVDHDCEVEAYVHIAPGAVLCGRVRVGEGSLIGAGSVLLPGVIVGKWAQVGAGAVVVKNVPDGATVVGNPARIIKSAAV
jgi:sugar O-acyltransferase (sialic acid O-acetyltransferase NeuD family)